MFTLGSARANQRRKTPLDRPISKTVIGESFRNTLCKAGDYACKCHGVLLCPTQEPKAQPKPATVYDQAYGAARYTTRAACEMIKHGAAMGLFRKSDDALLLEWQQGGDGPCLYRREHVVTRDREYYTPWIVTCFMPNENSDSLYYFRVVIGERASLVDGTVPKTVSPAKSGDVLWARAQLKAGKSVYMSHVSCRNEEGNGRAWRISQRGTYEHRHHANAPFTPFGNLTFEQFAPRADAKWAGCTFYLLDDKV